VRIFLVGFMGAGKTSVGSELARRLGYPFLDVDQRVEAALGMTVAEVFASLGEPAFRAEETRQLGLCGRFGDAVVATGGGLFTFPHNRERIRRLGVSVFLDVPWAEILARLPGKRGERPLFSEPEHAYGLYRSRLPHYRTADLAVNPNPGEDPAVLAGRIGLLLEGWR
jgi:shikimate kinase